MVHLMEACLLTALQAYLLGSLLFGVLVSKLFYHDDVRLHGSGNAGMTNVLRTYGKLPAVITTIGDVGKSVVAAPKGFPALPVPTKSPRFPFPSPKSPNRLIPSRLFPLPVRPATTPRRYPAPACKSLGMVKGWRLRMENPFSKEGSPPTVPSPLPQVPCRPPLPTPSRMKSSGRCCCRSA